MAEKCECGRQPTWESERKRENGQERWLTIRPGFLCSQERNPGWHGQHGAEVVFYSRSPETGRIVQLQLLTGWPPNGQQEWATKHGLPAVNLEREQPLASADIHSPTPWYEGQMSLTDECALIGGVCYFDGSSLFGQDVCGVLLTDGVEAMYRKLEEWRDDA